MGDSAPGHPSAAQGAGEHGAWWARRCRTAGAQGARGRVAGNRVELRITDDIGFELEATSFSGSIDSELPLSTEQRGSSGRRTLEGTFGDGSASLDITSFSGDITIERR